MDLTKNGSDHSQEKKFYCPTEGCVFSKGYGKSFKKKMLVDQVRKFRIADSSNLFLKKQSFLIVRVLFSLS